MSRSPESKGLHEAVFPVLRAVVLRASGEWVGEPQLLDALRADWGANRAIERNADELGWTWEKVASNEIDWWKGTWWSEVGQGLEQREATAGREFRSTLPAVTDDMRAKIAARRARRD